MNYLKVKKLVQLQQNLVEPKEPSLLLQTNWATVTHYSTHTDGWIFTLVFSALEGCPSLPKKSSVPHVNPTQSAT